MGQVHVELGRWEEDESILPVSGFAGGRQPQPAPQRTPNC